MTLSAAARSVIRGSGITIAAYIRGQMPWSGQDGRTWRGDDCGCTDDRCIGFHHDEQAECGCLPVLLRDTVERLERSSTALDTARLC